MNMNRRSLFVGAAATALVLPIPNAAAKDPWRRAAFGMMEGLARRLVDTRQVTGIAVGISARDYRQSAYFGYADQRSMTPVTENTNFRIASVTKPMVAACVLQLEEAGLISLDQRIDSYFPEFPQADEISVYQLLTHTSGIGNWWGRLPADTPSDFMNLSRPDQWLARMTPVFNFQPGAMREYSNSGYVLLGRVIELVTGKTLNEALDHFVLSRVGAGSTFLEIDPDSSPHWATGHQIAGGSLVPAERVPPPFAAGGVRATLHDILAFGDAVFQGRLLEPQTRSRMIAHATVSDGRLVEDALYTPPGGAPEVLPGDISEMGYGLGINTWVQSNERFYSHAGLIDGFGSYFLHAPRTGTTIGLLANTFQGTSSLHEPIRQALIAAPTA